MCPSPQGAILTFHVATGERRRAAARVWMVAAGVDYARQLVRLIVAANGVRTKADWGAHQDVKREMLQYLKDHCLSWSSTVPHNYCYCRSAVGGVERSAKARIKRAL